MKRNGQYFLADLGKSVAEELLNSGLTAERLTAKPRRRRKLTEQKEVKTVNHNEIVNQLFEIGQMEGKYPEKEYPIDNLRLDVVWKSIPTGNPKWAFEVQIAGNFYEALTKLKHAWDKWNSKPFLITTEKYIE